MRITRRHLLAAAGLASAAVVGGTLGTGLVYRAWWNQPADPGTRLLSSDELDFLDALADAIFPPDSGLPLRGREAHVGRSVDLVLSGMHENQSRLLRLSLHALDQYPLPTHGTAFRNLDPGAAGQVLASWVSHDLAEVRGLMASLYIFVAMAWSIHPEVAPTFAAQFKCGYGA